MPPSLVMPRRCPALAPTLRFVALAFFASALSACASSQSEPLDQQAALRELDQYRRPLRPSVVRPSSSSDTAGQPGAGLGSDEAVAIALVSNPDLRAFRREREVAEGEIVAASAIDNPTIRLEMLHIQELGSDRVGWGVGLRWTPPQPAELAAKKAHARARLDEVRQQIFEQEWVVAADVRLAHDTAVEYQRQVQVADKSVEIRRKLVEALQERVARGATSRVEMGVAEIALVRAQQEREELAVQQAIATHKLLSRLGVTAPQEIQLSTANVIPDDDTPVPDPQELASRALANRPLFRLAAARYEQRVQALRVEQTKRWPWFELSAFPRYRRNDTARYSDDLSASVDISIPVFDRNTGNIAVAEARKKQEYEKFIAAVVNIRRETALACAELNTRRAALLRYRDHILPTVEEQERLIDTSFQARQADLSALLAAQDAIMRIRREYGMVRLAYHKAWLDLARIVGALPNTFAKRQ